MWGGFRFLRLVKPFLPFLPEVQNANRKADFEGRFLYTIKALCIFLICSHVPLYGTHSITVAEPFYRMLVILAPNRGTIMELGITPVVTSQLVMQLLVGSNIIQVDNNIREDRALLNGAQKLLGILIVISEAVAYVLSGMYGTLGQLGVTNAVLIILQLCFAGIMMVCLDERLQKGYGFGSGLSLFMAANICESVIWGALSPVSIITDLDRDAELEGALPALFQLLITRTDKARALRDAFFRQNLPNMTNLLSTGLIFFIAIYSQGFRVVLPERNINAQQSSYPIKLFCISHMPIILQSALASNLYFISLLLYKRFGGNCVVDLIGKWQGYYQHSGKLIHIGGLAYYITPPSSLANMAANPFHALFYIVFMLSTCALLSKTWIEVSGFSAKSVAEQLKEQQMVKPSQRDSNVQIKELNRYVVSGAAFGGMCIGALIVLADFMGAIGSGTGILVAATILYQHYETYEKELTWSLGLMD